MNVPKLHSSTWFGPGSDFSGDREGITLGDIVMVRRPACVREWEVEGGRMITVNPKGWALGFRNMEVLSRRHEE